MIISKFGSFVLPCLPGCAISRCAHNVWGILGVVRANSFHSYRPIIPVLPSNHTVVTFPYCCVIIQSNCGPHPIIVVLPSNLIVVTIQSQCYHPIILWLPSNKIMLPYIIVLLPSNCKTRSLPSNYSLLPFNYLSCGESKWFLQLALIIPVLTSNHTWVTFQYCCVIIQSNCGSHTITVVLPSNYTVVTIQYNQVIIQSQFCYHPIAKLVVWHPIIVLLPFNYNYYIIILCYHPIILVVV